MPDLFKKIIRYCLYLSLFAPLFVSGAFVFPYVFPKTALFQILVEIAFAFWILLMAIAPEYRLPRFAGLTKIIAVWLVVLFFVSLAGVNFYHSLWSSYERMTGLITLFHYFAYFLILLSILKTEKEWLQMFDFSVIASLAVSFIGLLQNFGALMSPAGGRVAASFGNPSFLAAYLLFNIFFICFLLYKKYFSAGWRIYYLLALLFELFILGLTETRGAVLALLIGIFLFLILFLLAPQKHLQEFRPSLIKKLKLFTLVGLVILILLVGFIVALRQSGWITKIPVVHNLVAISLQERTAQTRLMAWQMSIQGWKEKFLLGWGWENYNVVFNKFYNPYLFPTETWFDRAHSIFFDTVITGGLLGLAAYLAMFVIGCLILARGYFQNKINFFTAALFIILLVVYFLQNLFVFDMLHSYLMFFLVLGFIGFVEHSISGLYIQPSQKQKNKKQIPSFLSVSVTVLLILAVYFINIKPALASFYTIEALKTATQKSGAGFYKQDKIIGTFERGLKYGTFGRWENSMRLGEYALDLAAVPSANDKVFEDDLKKVFNAAIDEMEKTVKANSMDARYQIVLGSLYFHSAQYDSSRIYSADKIFTKALELNPTKQDIMYTLSQIKLTLGKKDEAGDFLRRAVELNPGVGQSHWTLGLYYLLMGDKVAGKAEIERALLSGYKLNSERIQKLAAFYEKLGAYDEIASLYQKAIETDPNNAQWHASLAATYAQMGNKEKAKEEVDIAMRLNPNLRGDAEQFLKNLK